MRSPIPGILEVLSVDAGGDWVLEPEVIPVVVDAVVPGGVCVEVI